MMDDDGNFLTLFDGLVKVPEKPCYYVPSICHGQSVSAKRPKIFDYPPEIRTNMGQEVHWRDVPNVHISPAYKKEIVSSRIDINDEGVCSKSQYDYDAGLFVSPAIEKMERAIDGTCVRAIYEYYRDNDYNNKGKTEYLRGDLDDYDVVAVYHCSYSARRVRVLHPDRRQYNWELYVPPDTMRVFTRLDDYRIGCFHDNWILGTAKTVYYIYLKLNKS